MLNFESFLIDNWFLLAIITIWSIVWTGIGLWKSARLGHKYWFVAILLINTVGILEILYIYYFAKKNSATGVVDENSNSTTA